MTELERTWRAFSAAHQKLLDEKSPGAAAEAVKAHAAWADVSPITDLQRADLIRDYEAGIAKTLMQAAA